MIEFIFPSSRNDAVWGQLFNAKTVWWALFANEYLGTVNAMLKVVLIY